MEQRTVSVPMPVAELLDRIEILRIKLEKITDEEKQNNINAELQALLKASCGISLTDDYIQTLLSSLRNIHRYLWNAENKIRAFERDAQFGEEFIQVARSIYQKNDARHEIKRKLNIFFGSTLRDEKIYTSY